MYKTAVRALIRHGIARMNDGDPEFMLKLGHPEAELIFPGDNSWSTMFRPVEKGRKAFVTHRGLEECRAFADRFIAEALRYTIEDILVNGPPWNTRVAVRAVDSKPGEHGDEYNNRFISFLEITWGRLRRWEVYEDTERSADWDRRRGLTESSKVG
jgi:ketosteroid isomerase-like protein